MAPGRAIALLAMLLCAACTKSATPPNMSPLILYVVGIKDLTNPPWTGAYFIKRANDGGYLLASEEPTGHGRLTKLNASFKPTWSNEEEGLDKSQGALFVSEASDGGLWTGGVEWPVGTPNIGRYVDGYPYIEKRASDGHVLLKKIISTTHNVIECGASTGDGIVVTGWTGMQQHLASGEPVMLLVPWIAMLNSEGAIIWEKTVPEDEELVLSRSPELEQACSSLVTLGDGAVIWAPSSIGLYVRHNNIGPYISLSGQDDLFVARRLLIKFDATGHELRRVRDNAVNGEFLFAKDSELTLIEHSQLHHSIRLLRFDHDLKPLETKTLTTTALLQRLTAVTFDSSDGYFLAGCGEHHSESVVHIDDSGGLSSAGVGFGSCSYWMEFADSDNPDAPFLHNQDKLIRFILPRYD